MTKDTIMSSDEVADLPSTIRVNKKTEPGSAILRSISDSRNLAGHFKVNLLNTVMHLDLSCQKLVIAPMIEESC